MSKIVEFIKKFFSFLNKVEDEIKKEDVVVIEKKEKDEEIIIPSPISDPVVVIKKPKKAPIKKSATPTKKKTSPTKKSSFEVFPEILYGINTKNKIPGALNFTYAELLKSATAKRKKIKNIPTKEQFKKLIITARKILQPVRNQFGKVIVTSGFRCIKLCLAIGSTKNSNHARGEAVDFYVADKNVDLFDVVSWIYHNLEFRELILEFSKDNSRKKPLIIHCAYREGGNIKMLKHPETYKKISLQDLKKYLQE